MSVKLSRWLLSAGLILFVLAMQACSGVRRLDPDEFMEMAWISQQNNSFYYVCYIGTVDGRVYLQKWRAPILFGPSIKVYWTYLSGLHPDLARMLEAGVDPWGDPVGRISPTGYGD